MMPTIRKTPDALFVVKSRCIGMLSFASIAQKRQKPTSIDLPKEFDVLIKNARARRYPVCQSLSSPLRPNAERETETERQQSREATNVEICMRR
jgi:hypothetical protein